MPTVPPLPIVALSTEQFDPRHRVAEFESAAAAICKLAIVPEDRQAYASSTVIKVMPGAVTARTTHSASVATRTRAMAADETDNLLIHVPLTAGFSMQQLGGPATECHAGEIYLDPNEVSGRAAFHAPRSEMFYISIPRAVLAPVERALNGRLRQAMPLTPQWRMFLRYARALDEDAPDLTEDERQLCCTHLHDLARMALDADEAARLETQGRGLRAARLRALKARTEALLTQHGLTLAQVALAEGISERYARDLFAEDGTTFRDHLMQRRLRRMRQLLADPAQDHRPISELAMQAGFGDLSWFNRCYRQMFGETPTDSRDRARLA